MSLEEQQVKRAMSNQVPDQRQEDEHAADQSVLSCADIEGEELCAVLRGYGVELVWIEDGAEIPSSYWGESEAGIKDATLFVRSDTPVHSALHEGCHLICSARAGRRNLDTDAGGEQIEEDAVCYLQIVLADHITGFGRDRACADMDAWGYSFRLGSAQAWFQSDAEDALAWLEEHGLP